MKKLLIISLLIIGSVYVDVISVIGFIIIHIIQKMIRLKEMFQVRFKKELENHIISYKLFFH